MKQVAPAFQYATGEVVLDRTAEKTAFGFVFPAWKFYIGA